jgi:hypothetical protein
LEVRAHANSNAGSRIYIVTTMRSDFLGPGFELVEVFLRRSRTVAERERVEAAACQKKQAWLERA